jgi:hypothetical protein
MMQRMKERMNVLKHFYLKDSFQPEASRGAGCGVLELWNFSFLKKKKKKKNI